MKTHKYQCMMYSGKHSYRIREEIGVTKFYIIFSKTVISEFNTKKIIGN
jgi:hypothetical protein